MSSMSPASGFARSNTSRSKLQNLHQAQHLRDDFEIASGYRRAPSCVTRAPELKDRPRRRAGTATTPASRSAGGDGHKDRPEEDPATRPPLASAVSLSKSEMLLRYGLVRLG